jgi:hypothetical protein
MRPRVVHMHQRGPFRLRPEVCERGGIGCEASFPGALEKRRFGARQQNALLARVPQTIEKQEYLALAAAHFAPGIHVHNPQRQAFRPGLIARALAYFTKL